MATVFASLFEKATGRSPYRYQERFAEESSFDILAAPTGAGKTAAVILGWLFRRRFADEAIQKATPRRLVYCLPMRTLVEQTAKEATAWLVNLGITDIRVHKLLGGDVAGDWMLRPEDDAILVGTQDMLLSRALNRGYAAGRFHWPIDFGLLNNDCLWVFDEVQLMGAGVATSAQLAGLRNKLGTFGPTCRSVWMSATLDKKWLATVDFRDRLPSLAELRLDEVELTTGDLGKRMTAKKIIHKATLGRDASDKKYAEDVAKAVAAGHEAGSRTLVVMNTVDRARAVFEALSKQSSADVMLIHSRFRPPERASLNDKLRSEVAGEGRIIVATQVVEAGVDISARLLVTELAPWPSMVQRLGRCHRYGELADAGEVLWLDLKDEKTAKPYEAAVLDFSRTQLEKLEGRDVSPHALQVYQVANDIVMPLEHKHVLRRRDLLDLFDTAPDLSGNDIDISRFVRDDEKDSDVSVFWREFDAEELDKQSWPHRDELCSVPIGRMKDFLEIASKSGVYRKDHLEDKWLKARDGDVRPGMVLLMHRDAGGYDSERGWCGDEKAKPPPMAREPIRSGTGEKGVGSDERSRGPVQTLRGHTQDVCDQLAGILGSLDFVSEYAGELRHAARWHDLGKAHQVFKESMRKANPMLAEGVLWAKSGSRKRLRHERKQFRHELASALAMMKLGHAFLATYLVAAHHGRVRLAIRSVPGEKVPTDPNVAYALGIHDGDVLGRVDLGAGTMSEPITLGLKPVQLGEGSWSGRALELLGELGPFRLAYLEALLRMADWRASDGPKTEVENA